MLQPPNPGDLAKVRAALVSAAADELLAAVGLAPVCHRARRDGAVRRCYPWRGLGGVRLGLQTSGAEDSDEENDERPAHEHLRCVLT